MTDNRATENIVTDSRIEIAESDSRPSEELVELVFSSEDDDESWQAIAVLHARATEKEYNLAVELCRSENPDERSVGADILGQLGLQDFAFLEESVSVLIEMLSDSDDDVLNSVTVALGHRSSPRAVPHLARLKDHPEPQVRQGVAFGLVGQTDELAVATLIQLSNDPDDETRNWATFGLGTEIEANTPEVLQALIARIEDPEFETRGEAIYGLAKRRYPETASLVQNECESDEVSILVLAAAEELADPVLYPVLEGLAVDFAEEDTDPVLVEQLEAALAACRPSVAQ